MIRDTHSKALVETDLVELQNYRKSRKKDREFEDLKREVTDLRMCINRLNENIKNLESKQWQN